MGKQQYDLAERLLDYSYNIYQYCVNKKFNPFLTTYRSQLAKSSSSIGANYAEANSSHTRKDFRVKISIAKKEAQESLYWLKLIQKITADREAIGLISETYELVRILHTIHKNSR